MMYGTLHVRIADNTIQVLIPSSVVFSPLLTCFRAAGWPVLPLDPQLCFRVVLQHVKRLFMFLSKLGGLDRELRGGWAMVDVYCR